MSSHSRKQAANAAAKVPSPIFELQRDLRARLVSAGGRPCDPAPTIRRLLTIRKEVWKELQRHAALLSRLGQAVSPGQLGSVDVELEELAGSFARLGARSRPTPDGACRTALGIEWIPTHLGSSTTAQERSPVTVPRECDPALGRTPAIQGLSRRTDPRSP